MAPSKVTLKVGVSKMVKDGHVIKKRLVFTFKDKVEMICKAEGGESYAGVSRFYSVVVNESNAEYRQEQRCHSEYIL